MTDDPVFSAIEALNNLPKGERFAPLLKSFYLSYLEMLRGCGGDLEKGKAFFKTYTSLVKEQLEHPFRFSPFHRKIKETFNYENLGIEFVRTLIDWEASIFLGENNAEIAEAHLKKGGNVVFLANHQIEPDPQVIQIFLEEKFPYLADALTFVAGERVVTDPLAIPFSMGCNLITIYSKRYIDTPPELKEQKREHNLLAMGKLKELFEGGGAAIYVAPSGGRDRKNNQGVVQLAPFDPQSVEMFRLTAERGKRETLFIPMALATYNILPPPKDVQTELGEIRQTCYSPAGLALGSPLDFSSRGEDKKQERILRAEKAFAEMEELYSHLKI